MPLASAIVELKYNVTLIGSLLLLHGFGDLISICSYSEFCVDQLRIPFGVQSTDATANGGLAPKPPESGVCTVSDGVSVGKDTQSYEYFLLCYDDPAPGQG